jgi:signal peptidase
VKKIAARVFTVILSLILAGLLFVYFSPDYGVYVVRSESMKPAINMGDVVFTGPVGGPIKGNVEGGTVVTYQNGTELVTHRVVSRDGDTIVTKGDAVEDADPWQVNIGQIKGVYLFKVPSWGYAWKFTRDVWNYAHTKKGWLLVVVLPASILIGVLANELLKELRKKAAGKL